MTSYLPGDAAPYSIGRFSGPGIAPFTGLAVGTHIRSLSVDRAVTIDELLADWDNATTWLDSEAAAAGGTWFAESDVRPLVPWHPDQVLQAGANYRKHVVDIVISELDDDEQGRTPQEKQQWAEDMMDARAAHGQPYVFLGSSRAMTGALDDVVLPVRAGAKHDWELEVGVVIGRRARHINRHDALDHIAGYTIVNDISSRDVIYRPDLKKIGTDWLAAKNSPTFLPTGPVIVPAAFVPDPADLQITLRHNAVLRQDEAARDMIFDIPRLIEYCSALTELLPGDLLLTGSPAGNGAHWGVFLQHGDILEAEITGLGRQRNACRDEVIAP